MKLSSVPLLIASGCVLVCQGCNTASLHLGMTDEQVVDWAQERFRIGDSSPHVQQKLRDYGLSVTKIGLAPNRATFESDSDRAMYVEVHKRGIEVSNPLHYSKFPPKGTLLLYFTEQSELEVMHWIRPVQSEQLEWHFIDGDPIRIELAEAAQ